MAVETSVAPSKPRLTFVLVHGTFGRGGSWMDEHKEGSLSWQLNRDFKGRFDVHFERVDWGVEGPLWKRWPDNTEERRRTGALGLVQRLEGMPDVSPTNLRYVVAHSHGGNVVMYALRNSQILNKVTGIVCLSTPFLQYAHGNFHRDVLVIAGAVLFFFALDRGNPFLWAYFAAYAAVVFRMFRAGHFGDRLESVAEIKVNKDSLRVPARDELRNTAGDIPILAVRPHRDEVAILFFVAQHAGVILRALWQFVNTVVRWALYGVVLVAAIGWVRDSYLPQLDLAGLDPWVDMAEQYVLTPLTLFATAVLLGMAVMRWSFAFDSLPWLASLDVRSTIYPWEGKVPEGAQVVRVDKFYLLKRHTRVQNQSPPKIRAWIRNSHRIEGGDAIT